MRGLPQKQNARRADKIRLCGHLGRYKKIVKKTYIILIKNKVIREITCPMNWNYESEEAVLKELSYANFRCVKVSDTLLFARKK